MDMPDVANVEEIALSPSDFSVTDDPVYQELHCTAQEAFNDCSGRSPDQGYESDSLANVAYGSSFTSEASSNFMLENILATTTTPYNLNSSPVLSSANTDMSSLVNFGHLKTERNEDLPGWPDMNGQTFTDTLQDDLSYLDFIDLTNTSESIEATQMHPIPQEGVYTSSVTYPHQSHATKFEPEQVFPPVMVATYPAHHQLAPATDLEISEDEGVEEMQVPDSNKQHAYSGVARKRRQKSSKQPILWKFLLAALNNPEKYGEMIRWVNIDVGTFQFTSQRKEELSKQWGLAKRNRCQMTYQKMARAMRNYINRGEVLRKVKKKLQYTFLPDFYKSIKDQVQR